MTANGATHTPPTLAGPRVRALPSLKHASPEHSTFLTNQTANPFLWLDWLRQFWARFGRQPGHTLLLLGVYRGDSLITVAPLFARRLFSGMAVISMIGEGYSDYLGFAGEVTEESVGAVLQAAAQRFPRSVFRFADLTEDDPLKRVLDHSALIQHPAFIQLYPCPFREFDPAALAAVPKSNLRFQRQVKRYGERLAQMGSLEFHYLDFDHEPRAAQPYFSRLFHVHALRHECKRNLWNNPAKREFLLAVAQAEGPTGLRGFVTLLDRHLVAFELGFLAAGRFTAYITGFHPALARFRPGHVNMMLAFDTCARQQVRVYDFSKGDDLAKRHWETGRRMSYACLFILSRDPATRLAVHVLAGLPRLLAWGRLRGVNRRLKEATEKMVGRWQASSARQQAQPAPPPHPAPTTNGEFRRLQFGQVADLPLDTLTRLMDFAFAHSLESELEVCHTPKEIILRRADRGSQISLPLAEAAIL